jgi:hypothetical protein
LAVVTASGERPRSWTEPRISRDGRFAEDSTLEEDGFELLIPLQDGCPLVLAHDAESNVARLGTAAFLGEGLRFESGFLHR